jgi:hypothetical protein
VAASKSTFSQRSPRQLAEAQAGEGGGEVEDAFLVVLGGSDERHDLLAAEHVDAGAASDTRALDGSQRIAREAVGLHRPLEDRVEGDEVALNATVRQLGLLSEAAFPALEELRREALDGVAAELLVEDADDALVAGEGAGLHRALMLAAARPLSVGVLERRYRPHHADQLAGPGLDKRRVKPRLGDRLREVAGLRPAALRPRPAALLLDLAAIREPVLGVPDRPGLTLDAEEVAAN